MKLSEVFADWQLDAIGFNWLDYYYLNAGKWVRESKQRNYLRNKDINYKPNTTNKNKRDVNYDLVPFKEDSFIFDRPFLKYNQEEGSYSAIHDYDENVDVDKIRPFEFIKMEVNNNMDLVAYIPNIIMDAEFSIDKNNGNLIIKYG